MTPFTKISKVRKYTETPRRLAAAKALGEGRTGSDCCWAQSSFEGDYTMVLDTGGGCTTS